MSIPEYSAQKQADRIFYHFAKEKTLPLIALALIVALAAALRFAKIDTLGYVNHYYAAAVKSMLQSWHNFFFAAAEPGASVSVDKPPLGLWLQCISAYFLGINSYSLLLPQILAGIGSIILVYHLVQRSFGQVAGLLAALTLAVTPVVVAVDRNNTIDSSLIFTLLLAAWMFIKAAESARLRYLLMGSLLVGVAFNIKMLAAYIPLPAFFALYLFGAKESFLKKLLKLGLAGLVVLLVSFSWAAAVDLTPADQRPYVGSSSDNSELTLIIGYNGLNRLLGRGRNLLTAFSNGPQQNPPTSLANRPNDHFQSPPANPRQRDGAPQPNQGQPPTGMRPGAGDGVGANNASRTRGRGAPGDIGQAGVLRLFSTPLNKELSWLLPLGLVGMALLLVGKKISLPVSQKHQALILWGGWLVTGGVFFSVAGFFHEYYLALLGVPLAALVGIALVELWNLRQGHARLAIFLTLTAAAATLIYQYQIASAFVPSVRWLPPTLILYATGAVLYLALSIIRRLPESLFKIGFTLLTLSLFVTPAVWSALTALNPGNNLSLPAAYSGENSRPSNRGDVQVNPALLAFLQENTTDNRYLMAVPSSMQGADYVLATGRPVLYMGGFSGQDQVVSLDDLIEMTASGELRYIYLSGGGGPGGGQSEITAWVQTTCSPVEGFETTTRNFGTPDGTGNGGAPGNQAGNMQISLYDCES
jgi:4-amino-4-deoxy-L-arabinose transferase-like glycosyltransferase